MNWRESRRNAPVIEAEKINDLLAAERDLEIQSALAKAATERAKADVAHPIGAGRDLCGESRVSPDSDVIANASALQIDR